MQNENKQLICEGIIISFEIDAVGIVGGEYESEPSVHTWGSFNPHRIIKSHKLDPLTLENSGHIVTPKYVYGSRARKHKMNSHNYRSMFSLGTEKEKEEVVEVEEEEEEKVEFYVPQNNARYKIKQPIMYDLKDTKYHSHGKLRTDASIWLKLMVVSLFSGIPKIDENDRKFQKIKRDIQAGVCQLEMYELFKEAATQISREKGGYHGKRNVTIVFESAFVDPKLLNTEMAELFSQYQKQSGTNGNNMPSEFEQNIAETAFLKTRKAIIHFEITLVNFDLDVYRQSRFSLADLKTNPLNSVMNMHFEKRQRRLDHYNLEQHRDSHHATDHRPQQSFNPILYNSGPGVSQLRAHMEYVLQVYCNSFIPINDKDCLYQPMNQNVKKLHLPNFISEQGQQSVVGYFSSHTPQSREYPSKAMQQDETLLYDSDDKTERHYELMVDASLRRHGMSRKVFIETVNEHYHKENKKTVASGLYVIALKVVADVGTFAANSAYYTSDFRYQKLDNNAITKQQANAHYRKNNIDSFDSTILNGTGNADDCEGQANVTIAILGAFKNGRFAYKGKWQSQLLNTMKLVLDNHVIFAVGSTVTSAYVDNNNKPIDMKSEHADLPMIGDNVDVNSRCDGHCYGIMIPIAITDRLLANGNTTKEELAQLRHYWQVDAQNPVFPQREYTVPVLVLEGTGSIESTVLPVDEVFDYREREVEKLQSHVAISVMKDMKMRLAKENETDKNNIVMDMFSGEGIEFYVPKQPLNRRVSRFYREVIHGVPCDLYMKAATLSQIAFCNRASDNHPYEYGVNTGELLRCGSSAKKTSIALITPFAENKREWYTNVSPMMEAIQNQMPIMAFGHYSEAQYKNDIYSHLIETENQREVEALIYSVSGNKSLAIVRLQTREWKLTNALNVEKLKKFLGATPGLKGMAFYSEKHIPNCDALVDILLIVETKSYMK